MIKLVMNQMESVIGGDDIFRYCYSRHMLSREDTRLCAAELESGEAESGTHLSVNSLTIGCAGAGVMAILIGLLNPILGRVAAGSVLTGCTIAKFAMA